MVLGTNFRALDYETLWRDHLQEASTMSALCRRRPAAGERVFAFDCSLRDFLAALTFPVWYVGPDDVGFAHYLRSSSQRIRFVDALQREDFQSVFLAHYNRARGPIESADVCVYHCTGCDHYAVIDGNHRIAWLVDDERLDATLRVSVLSGSRWQSGTEDMDRICSCSRS